jgi:uncharacterized protein YaeQ
MALKSTIFKAQLQVSDLDRGYYAAHALTIARHPSENDQRMMVRLLAFALFADERLEFGRGISSEDEPALWQKNYGGEIERWIEVGLPDERLLRRAAGRADQVVVLAYGGRAVDVWWNKDLASFERLANLTVLVVADEDCAALAKLAERSMDLTCTVQDGQLWLSAGEETVTMTPRVLKRA